MHGTKEELREQLSEEELIVILTLWIFIDKSSIK